MNEYTITQLTDNNVDDFSVQTSRGNVVWSASDGNDDEIFFYDGDSVRQLTYNDDFDNIPQISGNNLAWQQTESDPLFDIFGGSEVIVYDGETETIETIAEVDSFTIPAISGDNVVWGEDFIFGGTVSLYDGESISELTDLGVFIPINSSSVSGDSVVWMSGFDENFAGFGDIFLYDGETTTQITDNASDSLINVLPSVSGNNIAWTATEVVTGNETGDIFLYNGEETIQLTDDDIQDAVIGISGDKVVWSSGDGFTESSLFLYDGTETIELTSNETNTFTGGSISGNNVVWSESDGNDTEIFLYDGIETIQITDNDTDDNLPDIDGDTIVWEGDDGNDGNDIEIFLATLDEDEAENSADEPLFTSEDFTGTDDGDILLGTEADDVLLGGLGDDTLIGVSGADTLNGGNGNDIYGISLASNGGTIIQDTEGLDFIGIIAENTDTSGLADGLYDFNEPAPYGDAALRLSLPQPGIMGIEKSGTDLIIDLNRDGVAEVENDLTIIDYFDSQGNLGVGAIEFINNVNDERDIVEFFDTDTSTAIDRT